MLERPFADQMSFPGHKGVDGRVGLEHGHAPEVIHLRQEPARVVHRTIDLKTVVDPQTVVLFSMSGRGMNHSGALFQGDVIPEDDRGPARNPWMAALETTEGGSPEPSQNPVVTQITLFGHAGNQIGSQDEDIVPGLQQRVFEVGMKAETQVGGEGPRGRGPDQNRDGPGSDVQPVKSSRHRKPDVDRGAYMF